MVRIVLDKHGNRIQLRVFWYHAIIFCRYRDLVSVILIWHAVRISGRENIRITVSRILYHDDVEITSTATMSPCRIHFFIKRISECIACLYDVLEYVYDAYC